MTFFALERFITLSDIIRTCGHVMDDVITLWWSRESWYDFSSSWTKFLSWWDFVCLGVILYLGDQPNLGMIFLRFGYNFRFSEIIFLLVLFHILVRSTASWYAFPSFCYALSSKCDFVWFGVILYLGAINCILVWSLCFGYWYFLYISFLILAWDFHFYTCIYNVLHMDRLSCCNVKNLG